MADELRDSRELFLAACKGEKTERPPVWLMRQAGRYLPEFRALRERHSFEELCKSPELATDATMMPMRRFDFDAAILFSDILVPLMFMDVGLRYVEGAGPSVERPLRRAEDVERVEPMANWEEHPFQAETLLRVRRELPRKAVIGFAGGPFTLSSYLIDGQPAERSANAVSFASSYPREYGHLMEALTDTVISSLMLQAEAEPDALQVFDTLAGHLSEQEFKGLALPYAKRIVSRLESRGIPIIYYCVGSGGKIELAAQTGADVIGVDSSIGLREARKRVQDGVALQGNLDPKLLLGDAKSLSQAVRSILDEGSEGAHIFNLGNGMLPEARIDLVENVVKEVRSFRR